MNFNLSALAVVTLVSACGGGGSSVSEQPPPAVSTSYSVSGNAIKGPMEKALVVAYKVKADGSKGDEIGRTTSSGDGGYSIGVSGYTGLVLVEVTATADTLMEDESTGAKISPPVGFAMRASVASPASGTAAGGTLQVQVNPLTEMAVSASLRKTGGLNTQNVESANAEIATVFGFNPTSDLPVFDKGVPKNKAAVLLAAISSVAKDGDLAECSSQSDQAVKIKCVVDQLALNGAQSKVIADALNLQVSVIAAKDGVPAGAKPSINTEVPPADPAVTAVAQAKSLMNTLRSNAKALSASELSLETEVTALSNDIDKAVRPAVDSTFEMLRTMDFGVQLLEDAQQGSGVYALGRAGVQFGAGCTVYTDDTFSTQATTKDNAMTVGCSSYASVSRGASDATTGVANTWRWRHRLLMTPKAAVAGAYVVKTQARREYGTCQNALSAPSCGTFTQTYLGTPDQGKPVPVGGYTDNSTYSVQRGEEGVADFTRTFTAGNLTALRLLGSTAPSLYYQGLGVNPVLDNGNGRRHEVELDVVKTVVNGVQKLSLNSDAFIKFFSRNQAGETYFMSSIGIGKDSFIEAPVVSGANNGTEKFDLRIGYVAGNSAVRGQLAAGDAKWDKTKTTYIPTKVTFGGRLERRANTTSEWVEFLRGNIVVEAVDYSNFSSNLPLSSNNPQKMKTTTNVVVTIKDRPTLVIQDLVVSVTDAGTVNNAALSGQYRQGSTVINVQGSRAAPAKPVVTLESSSGIRLVVDDSKTVHPMTKSGVKVGEFDTGTQRLSYVDGSFEQY